MTNNGKKVYNCTAILESCNSYSFGKGFKTGTLMAMIQDTGIDKETFFKLLGK